ncbi:MAG: MerR family transcriptional regulator [Rhodospirillales bacterium]
MAPQNNALTIGRAAKQAGVGVETIRFYERKGLITRPPRPAAGGFRDYPKATLGRIRFIREAQELGFSLAEIADLLALRADPKTNCRAVQRRAEAKCAEVRSKVARLKRIEAALGRLIAACPGEGVLGACSILEALEGVDEAGATPRRRKFGRAGHDD